MYMDKNVPFRAAKFRPGQIEPYVLNSSFPCIQCILHLISTLDTADKKNEHIITICLVWWNVVHLQIDSGSAGCDAGGAGGVLAAQRAWGATPSQQLY